MIRNTFGHSRCPLLPLAVAHANALAQSLMGSDEIVISIIKLSMSLEHLPVFRKGQHFATGPAIAVSHIQVVSLNVAGIDLVTTATGFNSTLAILR